MEVFLIVMSAVVSTIFILCNIFYAVNGFVYDDYPRYDAFVDIWYTTEMNLFGKIVSSIFTGVFCCVAIFVLYAAKFIYWAFHYKKADD